MGSLLIFTFPVLLADMRLVLTRAKLEKSRKSGNFIITKDLASSVC